MTAAARTVRRFSCRFKAFAYPWQLIALVAVQAGRIGRIAMQFDHAFRSKARDLMQVVDVLSDDRGNFSSAMQRGQCTMSAPW